MRAIIFIVVLLVLCFQSVKAFPGSLNSIQSSQGFKVNGVESDDNLGWSVSSGGDIDGDGLDDILFGAPGSDVGGRSESGACYVIFGSSSFSGDISLPPSAAEGFAINGLTAGSRLGEAVSIGGDVNGDGFDDMLLGAPEGNVCYLVYGRSDWSSFSLSDLGTDSSEGIVITGASAGDLAGFSVSIGGDVNGDGFDDFLIGAPANDDAGTDAGQAYLIYGGASLPASMSLGSPSSGVRIDGEAAGDNFGASVSIGGNINSDPFDDFIVGAPYNDVSASDSGRGYVILGGDSLSATISMATPPAGWGFTLDGEAVEDEAGKCVSIAGDVNGDGFDDVLIGAPQNDKRGMNTGQDEDGEAYVIFGAESFPATISLASVTPALGFTIAGYTPLGNAGWTIIGAGDVNDDGFADILVSSPSTDPTTRYGNTFVIYGRLEFETTLQLENDFKIQGRSNGDWSGFGLAVGDVDGDGVDDVIIGAPRSSAGASRSGQGYVLVGGNDCFFLDMTSTCSCGPNLYGTNTECLACPSGLSAPAGSTSVTACVAENVVAQDDPGAPGVSPPGHLPAGPCATFSNCTCTEAEAFTCHRLAFCAGTDDVVSIPGGVDVVPAGVSVPPTSDGTFECGCYSGLLGHGYGDYGCETDGWSVRIVYTNTSSLSEAAEAEMRSLLGGVNCTRGSITSCDHIHYTQHGPDLGVNVLFPPSVLGQAAAAAAALAFNAGSVPSAVNPDVGARVYAWTAGTSSSPLAVLPSGLSVQAVRFEPSCATSGCWVLDVTYTTGSSDVLLQSFNTFFLPYAVGSDALSFDFDYASDVRDSYLPSNFPCRVSDYVGQDGSVDSLPGQATGCCFGTAFDTLNNVLGGDQSGLGLLGNYRVTNAFAAYASYAYVDLCPGGYDSPSIATEGEITTPKPQDRFPDGSAGFHADDFLATGQQFLGMPHSPGVTSTTALDAFIGQYQATIELDAVELRTKAGLLRGTAGVEHTVDFFLGYANFKAATGSWILDSLATQVAIHVETTSFFTVSTHGTNDYTFLEYVNLRLVSIYNEDDDFSGADETALSTVRTLHLRAAHYVQVTFTVGPQYGINENSGLVPLSSVRAGEGVFLSAATMEHKCLAWTNTSGYAFADADEFSGRLEQDCAPAASMCESPSSIPDKFVSFNIPLGIDYYDAVAPDLANNIFVDMVISAVDEDARDAGTVPNDGEAPWQMKTTLSASIPVVDGGVNIFCDGFTAKTDLKDVANADIVVGSAATAMELSRLRVREDIASTQLSSEDITNIDSDSIEAGLMTLVLKGNESYFSNGGRRGVSLELEDVITIHIMDDDGDGAGSGVQSTVLDLISAAADDNSDTSGLITEGYNLNRAFFFTVDRSAQRAHLEPSSQLLSVCPFVPSRPRGGNIALETCVTRRDVQYRNFPWRGGSKSTALEICANVNAGSMQGQDGRQCPAADATSSAESNFFTTILGDSDYARALAISYAAVIAEAYDLNGRYRRAFWINPGYEWTPTQTGGADVFSLSQKLFLFALISIDEGISDDRGSSITDLPGVDSVGPSFARRMLLQSTSLEDSQSSLGGQALQFAVTPKSMMAKAFDVPEELVAMFDVSLQLTPTEACMTALELQDSLRATFEDYLSATASTFLTAQVVAMNVNTGDWQCGQARRRIARRLLPSYSTAAASVRMMVVFANDQDAIFNQQAFEELPGITAVAPVQGNSARLVIDDTFNCGTVDCGQFGEDADGVSRSNNTMLVWVFACGSAGAVVVAVLTFLVLRWRSLRYDHAVPQSKIDLAALKAECCQDV